MTLDTNDPLNVYLWELATVPPLTRNEESDLMQHVMAHDEFPESSSRRLIEANLSLVVSIAERHRSSGVAMLDLVQKGNEGLLLTLQDFTKDSGDSFSGFASRYIEQAILKATADSEAEA